MDAVKFLKEERRMFASLKCGGEGSTNFGAYACHGVGCGECTNFLRKNGADKYGSDRYCLLEHEEKVRFVEEWAEKHPIITNATKFEETWGKKPIDSDGEYFCPFIISGVDCDDTLACRDCKKWWEEEYIQPGKSE